MEAAQEQTTIVSTTELPAGGDADYDDGRNDTRTIVAKGKRTKRQRPQSPIRFTFSSSNNDLTSLSSSGFPTGSFTAEDEDTAESLILLSKGQPLDLSTLSKTKDDNYDGIFKFNSKKYIQSPATGEAGMFVYECKTCGRTFPSFQALGGHRASHRKPRHNEDTRKLLPYTAILENNEPPPPPSQPSQCENRIPRNDQYYPSSSFVSLQLNNRASFVPNTIKASSKLHECSICGTEFNSGQALGGHMRRHRVANGNGRNKVGYSNAAVHNIHNAAVHNINTTALSLVPFNPVTTVEVHDHKSSNDALCLGLDLNLPAPQTTAAKDNKCQNRSLEFSPAGENEDKQQPAVHLTAAPTLVDCHY